MPYNVTLLCACAVPAAAAEASRAVVSTFLFKAFSGLKNGDREPNSCGWSRDGRKCIDGKGKEYDSKYF
jgi:hypothetical protein